MFTNLTINRLQNPKRLIWQIADFSDNEGVNHAEPRGSVRWMLRLLKIDLPHETLKLNWTHLVRYDSYL